MKVVVDVSACGFKDYFRKAEDVTVINDLFEAKSDWLLCDSSFQVLSKKRGNVKDVGEY